MDRLDKKPSGILPIIVALLVVYGLLSLLNLVDPFSNLLRPAIVWLFSLTGLPVENQADHLIIGKLTVPWTRDCAGINLLLLLWALLAWIHRDRWASSAFWIRILLAIPVSLTANLARILTLVAYRWIAYPATESASLHYLIGFLWILPFLKPLIVIKKDKARLDLGFLEIVYLMGILALAASHTGAPGGRIVLLAALVALVEMESLPEKNGVHRLIVSGWLVAGLMIGIAGMESLWIPFLLTCPALFPVARFKRPSSYGVILATIPLLAMQPVLRWVLLALLVLKVYEVLTDVAGPGEERIHRRQPTSFIQAALVLTGLLMPFLMPLVAWRGQTDWKPQGAQVLLRMDAHSYRLKVIAQPPDLQFYCYMPMGDGRHHSLVVCMRYRGVNLQTASESVMTDGDSWMKQYFYHNGDILDNYRNYVLQTSVPFSEAGINLIVTAPVGSMDSYAFEEAADAAIKRLFN